MSNDSTALLVNRLHLHIAHCQRLVRSWHPSTPVNPTATDPADPPATATPDPRHPSTTAEPTAAQEDEAPTSETSGIGSQRVADGEAPGLARGSRAAREKVLERVLGLKRGVVEGGGRATATATARKTGAGAPRRGSRQDENEDEGADEVGRNGVFASKGGEDGSGTRGKRRAGRESYLDELLGGHARGKRRRSGR